MDLITRTELAQLANEDGGTHVSIFMPTHRAGRETEGDPLHLKNMLSAVEGVLVEQGHSRAEARDLLAPAWELRADSEAWSHMVDGLALFLTPGGMRSYRLGLELPELAAVGDRFVLSPLLPLLADEQFYALTLSQRQVRVLRGSRNTIELLEPPGVPHSFEDVYEADHEGRVGTPGRSGGTVSYGSGVFDKAHQKELVEYFRVVSDGIQEALHGRNQPLVLVGLAEWVAAYRSVSRYPHVLEEAVERNPDDLSPQQLHDAVWPMIEHRLFARESALIEKFGQQVAAAHGVTTSSEALNAAQEGRVDTLLVVQDGCWASGNDGEVLVLGSETPHLCERIDAAAFATLTTGGQVLVVDTLPEDLRVGAILRY